MSFARNNAQLSEKQDAFLDALMGHMVVEFGAKEMILRMPDVKVPVKGELKPFKGFEERSPYKVLFCSDRVAVVASTDPKTGKEKVASYYFVDPDTIWIYTGSNDPALPDLHMREYFVRIR